MDSDIDLEYMLVALEIEINRFEDFIDRMGDTKNPYNIGYIRGMKYVKELIANCIYKANLNSQYGLNAQKSVKEGGDIK